jgi:hypothetical protein
MLVKMSKPSETVELLQDFMKKAKALEADLEKAKAEPKKQLVLPKVFEHFIFTTIRGFVGVCAGKVVPMRVLFPGCTINLDVRCTALKEVAMEYYPASQPGGKLNMKIMETDTYCHASASDNPGVEGYVQLSTIDPKLMEDGQIIMTVQATTMTPAGGCLKNKITRWREKIAEYKPHYDKQRTCGIRIVHGFFSLHPLPPDVEPREDEYFASLETLREYYPTMCGMLLAMSSVKGELLEYTNSLIRILEAERK